jgi:hypothetical protein
MRLGRLPIRCFGPPVATPAGRSGLAGVEFQAVDFPAANRLTIHILAAVPEFKS